MVDLESFRWNHRLALVFGPSNDDASVRQQHVWLDEQAHATAERELLVGYIFEDAPSTLGDQSLSAEDAAELRQTFRVPSGAFRFVLIGKDGGVKRNADAPVEPDDLFEQIDSMPMRQREIEQADANR